MSVDEIIEKIRKYGVINISKETGISKHTIYGWTNKERKPQKRLLCKIAKQFGVEVEE